MSENDASEDLLLRQPQADTAIDDAEHDEVQDFRVLKRLLDGGRQKKNVQLPKRGEKSAQLDTTAKQASMIDASRDATLEILSFTRSHHPKTRLCGLYDPATAGAWVLRARGTNLNTVGKWRRRLVQPVDVSEAAIPIVPAGSDDDDLIPISTPAADDGSDEAVAKGGLWLHPEEAIYLLERGSLDIRICVDRDFDLIWAALQENRIDIVDAVTEPMSVQAAYALFIGRPAAAAMGDFEASPFLTVEMYQVYAYLKRLGYTIVRACRDDDQSDASSPDAGNGQPLNREPARSSPFSDSLPAQAINTARPVHTFGPIFQPGLHRSFTDVFAKLKVVPFFHPGTHSDCPAIPYFLPAPVQTGCRANWQEDGNGSAVVSQRKHTAGSITSPSPPLRLAFNVYKPATHYSKKNPPPVDYRIAVVPARSKTGSLSHAPFDYHSLTALLAATPAITPPTLETVRRSTGSSTPKSRLWSFVFFLWPPKIWNWARRQVVSAVCSIFPSIAKQVTGSPSRFPDARQYYSRLQQGHRKVIVAIVDCGIISFLQLTDSAFGLTDIEWAYESRPNYYRDEKGGRGRGGRGRGRGGRGRGRGGRR